MWWISGITVAFVLAVVGVGVLGRSATARWERDERAARAQRTRAVPPADARPGAAGRLRGAVVRAAAPVAGVVRAPLSVSARVLTRARTRARRRIQRTPVPGRRLVPRVRDALRAAAGRGMSARRRRTAEARRTGGRRRTRIAVRSTIEPSGGESSSVGPSTPSVQESHDAGVGGRSPGGGSDE
jgi:hypothetical protein